MSDYTAIVSQVTAVTNPNVDKFIVDQIATHRPLWNKFWAKKKIVDGGDGWATPLRINRVAAQGTFVGDQTLDITGNNILDRVTIDPVNVYTVMRIVLDDQLQNSGSSKIVDLVKAEVAAGIEDHSALLAKLLVGDGTVPSGYSADRFGTGSIPNGIQQAVDDGTNFEYANITPRSTYLYWKAIYHNFATANINLAKLEFMQGEAELNDEEIDYWVTTKKIRSVIYNILLATQRQIYAQEDTVRAGWKYLVVNDKPLIRDDNVASGHLYGLNLDHLMLKVHKDRQNKRGPWEKPINQEIIISKILLNYQLYCDKPATSIKCIGVNEPALTDL